MGKDKHLKVRLFYGSLAALLLYTLIAQCILTHSEGRSLINTFSYFTIQSNVLVLITSAILAIRPTISGTWWRLLRLAALVGITVTGIVYWTILAPYVHLSGIAVVYNYIFHGLMPLATFLGFFFVEPRLHLRQRDMAFMAWPIAWLIYTFVRGIVFKPEFNVFSEQPSHFPYGFLDIYNTPMAEVIIVTSIVALLIAGVGIFYIWYDKRRISKLAV